VQWLIVRELRYYMEGEVMGPTSKVAKTGAVASILLASFHTYADGPTGARSLQTVQVLADQFVYVSSSSGAFSNPDVCGNSEGVIIRRTDVWFKEAVSALMLAKASNLRVQFWVTGCGWTPWGYTLPIVYSVTVDP
jgi:hypothetical protein